ncbi:plasmid partitioning protein RepB [Ensifer soli]|uniref:plasmid partitioning protein RepB n=1 Tax=Ciceribacter sp. sgz301302 TaxID=3342379 RepID=UPI0035B8383D
MAGRDRKNSLKQLFGGDIAPASPEASMPAPEQKSMTPFVAPGEGASGPDGQGGQAGQGHAGQGNTGQGGRTASGAIKAMGLSLSSITREAEEARALREALASGERVLSLSTETVEASFVADRMSDEARDDPDFLALVDSMRDHGQQVPILVRPIAGRPEHYQVAYGHRRLKAARRLGRPVQAIVRPLTDDELVLAQGKENAERRNLSFIERALFAQALAARGFDRRLIGEALVVQKSELSRLMQVADAVPIRFAHAVGPAPKAGRERWMALAEIFENGNGAEVEKAIDEVHSARFRAADTDTRFQMLFDRLKRPKPPAPEKPGTAARRGDGRLVARVTRRGRAVSLAFADDVDAGFLAALGERIAADYEAYLAARAAAQDGTA